MSTNNKSLEADLHSLLPSLAGLLPPELIAVSSSLLAQSRTRISNLKPNEEPARSYVCAHLACERLKNTLDLPMIAPRPPLPKRAYESLLAHFRKSLVTSSAASKPQTTHEVQELDEELREEIKEWMVDLGTGGAEKYVAGGVSAVLALHRKVSAKGTVYAVVCAVALLALERMSVSTGEETCGGIKWVRNQGYAEKRNEIMRVIMARRGARIARDMVDHWVKELSAQGFGKWGWMRDIPNGIGFTGLEENTGDKRAITGEVKPRKAVIVRRRAAGGTRMIQDKVDYLSDKKRAAYKVWKKEVLWRCEQIDADKTVV